MSQKTLEERVKTLEAHISALNAMNTSLIVRAERAELAVEDLQIEVECLVTRVFNDE